MKALILAGGRGKRLESHSAHHNKCMLEFAGKPLIEHSLMSALSIGAAEIVIVVGSWPSKSSTTTATTIAEYASGTRFNTSKGAGSRHRMRGPIPRILCFMLLLADEILLDPNHLAMIRLYETGACLRCAASPALE